MAGHGAELQLPELTTTLDPSYVIHLIRTFLAPDQSKNFEASQGNGYISSNEEDKAGLAESEGNIASQAGASEDGRNAHPCEEPESLHQGESARDNQTGGGSLFVEQTEQQSEPSGDSQSAKQQEEAGCVLWDLASDSGHAAFLLQQQICAVIMAVLSLAHSNRIGEIALGILANIACHSELVGEVTHPGLLAKVGEELQGNDPPTLTELCRLLSAALHPEGEESSSWSEILQSEESLERLLWIAENTNHQPLQEKSLEVLLALLGSPGSAVFSKLLNLGLPERLTKMLASEASEPELEERGLALNLLLQIGENLSTDSVASKELVKDSQLFTVVGNILKLALREELGTAIGSTVILLANLLAEDRTLVGRIATDPEYLYAFLRILRLLDDDPGARAAFWSVHTRVTARFLSECETAQRQTVIVVTEGAEDVAQSLEEEGWEEDTEARVLQESAVRNLIQVLDSSVAQNACVFKDISLRAKVKEALGNLKRHLQTQCEPPDVEEKRHVQ